MKADYDVFLSYNSVDHNDAQTIAKELASRGLRVWFDKWEVEAGLPVQDQMEAGLRSSRAMAFLIGVEGLGPWQRREIDVSLQAYVKQGRPLIPVLLPGLRKPFDMPPFLKGFGWVDCCEGVSEDRLERLVRAIVGKPDVEMASTPSVLGPKTRYDGRRHRSIVLVTFFVLAIVAVAGLWAWSDYSEDEKRRTAAENSLLVLDITDFTGDSMDAYPGDQIADMLSKSVARCESVRVATPDRRKNMRQMMTNISKKHSAVDDFTTAVCQSAGGSGLRWLQLVSCDQKEGTIEIRADIIDLTRQYETKSFSIEHDTSSNLWPAMDSLALLTLAALPFEVHSKCQELPDVLYTSSSDQARNNYYLGWQHFEMYDYEEAEDCFDEATGYDSTYAMAYYYLAYIDWNDSDYHILPEDRRQNISKAMQYRCGASPTEQLYIECLNYNVGGKSDSAIQVLHRLVELHPSEQRAHFGLAWLLKNFGSKPDYDMALLEYNRAIAIDPNYADAWNGKAYLFHLMGHNDSALISVSEYMRLTDNLEWNPFDTRADIFAYVGEIDSAVSNYKQALDRKPDYDPSLRKLGHLYLAAGEYLLADSLYRTLYEHESMPVDVRTKARTFRALPSIHKGKMKDALTKLSSAISEDSLDHGDLTHTANKHLLKALIYLEEGDVLHAVGEAETCVTIGNENSKDDPVRYRDFLSYILASAGMIHRADTVAAQLKAEINSTEKPFMSSYWLAVGAMNLAKGDYEKAVEFLEMADKDAQFRAFSVSFFHVRYYLARAYLLAGRHDEAIESYEAALQIYDDTRANASIESIKALYWLAMAYENSGRYQKAIEHYDAFLTRWGEADSGLAAVSDAREGLIRSSVKLSQP